MLDYLEHDDPLVRHASREWLVDSIHSLSHILDPLLEILLHKTTRRYLSRKKAMFYTQIYDCPRIIDAFRKMRNIIHSAGNPVITYFFNTKLSQNIKELDNIEHGHLRDSGNVTSYGDMLVVISIRFIISQALESINSHLFKENLAVNSASS